MDKLSGKDDVDEMFNVNAEEKKRFLYLFLISFNKSFAIHQYYSQCTSLIDGRKGENAEVHLECEISCKKRDFASILGNYIILIITQNIA